MSINRSVTQRERVLLIHIDHSGRTPEREVEEFQLLVAALTELEPVGFLRFYCRDFNPRYYLGVGQVETTAQSITENKVDLVIFNHNLSPAQERNLEKRWCCRVLGRVGLILAIFAKRAKTYEGKLQVELAQLQHLATRLVRGWTHLERQKGGIGLRGPGESQLETDRRLLGHRVSVIKQQLQRVSLSRQENRKKRKRSGIPCIALVGYTNAGKSSLLNVLTGADLYVEDQLFATLDPSVRHLNLPQFGTITLIDTVGFINDLPHTLIDAFKATLEETKEATLLLHVVNVADPDHLMRIEQVGQVLEEIGAKDLPQLLVYNKLDLLAEDPYLVRNAEGQVQAVFLSALGKGQGLDLLKQALLEYLTRDYFERTLVLAPSQAKLRAMLYAQHAVLTESIDAEGNFILHVKATVQTFACIDSQLEGKHERE